MTATLSMNDVVAWLRTEAVQAQDPADLLARLADQLLKTGMLLEAMTLEITTLHPLMAGTMFTWHRGSPITLETPRFHDPFAPGLTSVTQPSPRMTEKQSTVPPLPLAITFSDQSRHGLAAVAACEKGFSDGDADDLQTIAQALAAPLEILVQKLMTRTLMTTYLGKRTADRVLSGAIRRGGSDGIHAVLWYSDLRGFTAMSEDMPGDTVIALLNSHFERLAAPIKAFGGEVLKFIGDGLLAIFPVDTAGSAEQACRQAIKAVRSARAGMASLNGERRGRGERALEFGVALHLGEVMYGNIGAPDRLDFTVIGPTVNLANRLEALCKPLTCPVLLSATFEEACPATLTSVGHHCLSDIAGSIEIYTLSEFAPRPEKDHPPTSPS